MDLYRIKAIIVSYCVDFYPSQDNDRESMMLIHVFSCEWMLYLSTF